CDEARQNPKGGYRVRWGQGEATGREALGNNLDHFNLGWEEAGNVQLATRKAAPPSTSTAPCPAGDLVALPPRGQPLPWVSLPLDFSPASRFRPFNPPRPNHHTLPLRSCPDRILTLSIALPFGFPCIPLSLLLPPGLLEPFVLPAPGCIVLSLFSSPLLSSPLLSSSLLHSVALPCPAYRAVSAAMPPRPRIRLRLTRGPKSTESTPKGFADLEDEPMPDAELNEPSEHEEQPDQNDQDDADDTAAKPDESGDEDAAEKDQDSAKEPSPPPQPVIRRKRLGRPPKNKPPDWDPMVTVSEREADTPRRRGRGGWRGRGGRKGGPAAPKAEQVIDAEGTVAEIVDDECVLPEDPEGETKVDKNGNLQDGRDYRCRTFKVLGRGNRLYMLSTEPARCVGFRDSYLFFTKHRKLYKIIVDDDEKRDMIERDIIPHSYKGRSIGIVTARSVFREFGARIVVGGKRIIDDYNVAQARADGVVEGQVADPEDRFVPGEPYNKNQYVAWHGASAVYHTNVPSAPVPAGKPESRKRKVNVNDTNWMLEHAREASTFNAGINAIRRLNNTGVYDIHTNVMQYPKTMQPSHARIIQVAPEDEAAAKGNPMFPPVSLRMARNFLVLDTYYESAPAGVTQPSYEKAEPVDLLSSFKGLGAVSEEIRELLPRDCRQAFDQALDHEQEWESRWGPESKMASRRQPVIDKAIVPYNMS
ncbi:hypothetical protein S40288_08667, partial [Stachybotrys chartarum IBT 40288]